MAEYFTKKIVKAETRTVEVRFGNGLLVACGLDELKPEIVERLALHGLSQKMGDAASSFSKAENYHGAFGAIQSVVDNLQNGEWSSRGGSGTSDLAQAIAELQDLEIDEADEAVGKMDEEQIATFKKHPAIKMKIAEIQKRRLEAKVKDAPDLGAMMQDLLKR